MDAATKFHAEWKDKREPLFKEGDRVKIKGFTPGHDDHDPKKAYTVLSSHPAGYGGFHKLDGLTSNWPGTRLTRA